MLAALVFSVCSAELFHISKSDNRNIVVYEAVSAKDTPKKPTGIIEYWVVNEKGGMRENLTFIEKKLAFGHRIVSKNETNLVFFLWAFQQVHVTVEYGSDRFVAIAPLNGTHVLLEKIHVSLSTGGNHMPKVHYATVIGKDTVSGEPFSYIIRP